MLVREGVSGDSNNMFEKGSVFRGSPKTSRCFNALKSKCHAGLFGERPFLFADVKLEQDLTRRKVSTREEELSCCVSVDVECSAL